MNISRARLFIVLLLVIPGTVVSSSTIRQDVLQKMIKTFAPELRFHHKEKYFPSSVPWYTARCELRERRPDGSTHVVLPRPITNSSVLANYPTKDYPNGFNQLNDYYLNATQDEKSRAGEPLVNGQCKSTCYVHVQDIPMGLSIQYIFFYPYQGYTVGISIAGHQFLDIGSHEADWEHITVYLRRIDAGNVMSNYVLHAVHYAAHGNKPHGKLVFTPDVKTVGGTHPIVWVAQWGHASHEKNVGFDIKTLDNTSDDGVRWRCWESPLVDVGDREHPTPGNEWLIFGGRWGSTKEVTDTKLTTKVTNSPPGPAIDSPWWRHSPEQYDNIRTINAKFGSGRTSDYFDLHEQIPTRVARLRWEILHPEAKDIVFSVHERKRLQSDRKNVYGPNLGNNAITKISEYDKGLYIADVKTKSGKKLGGNVGIRIWAVEL